MVIFSALFFSVVLAIDTLAASFAYGASNIRVPMCKLITADIIGSALLSLSLFFGLYISEYISPIVTVALSAIIIISVGIYKLVAYFRKGAQGITEAPREINWAETMLLAVILSVDNIAVGVGVSIHNSSLLFCLCFLAFSLVTGFVFFIFGSYLGRKITKKTRLDLSWLSGVVLIVLGVIKLI